MDTPVWRIRKGDALVNIYIFCMKCDYSFLSFYLNYNQQIAKKLSYQINSIIKYRLHIYVAQNMFYFDIIAKVIKLKAPQTLTVLQARQYCHSFFN